jgi:hypothetical protein
MDDGCRRANVTATLQIRAWLKLKGRPRELGRPLSLVAVELERASLFERRPRLGPLTTDQRSPSRSVAAC